MSYTETLSWRRCLNIHCTVRWGGLGLRILVLLAPYVYLASDASTAELTSSLRDGRVQWNCHRPLNMDEAGIKSGIIGTVIKGLDNLGI